jgi:hypothetical protein
MDTMSAHEIIEQHEQHEIITSLNVAADLLDELDEANPDDRLLEIQNAIMRAARYLEDLRLGAHGS